jgi:hypothetical protein
MVFFVMCIKTRAVQIAGVRIAPDGDWMKQIARNLLDPADGFLRHATHLIHDRVPVFTEAWTVLLKAGGVTCVPIYHTERYHQGLGSQIIIPTPSPSNDNASLGAVGCRSRLGGLLNFYRREAA